MKVAFWSGEAEVCNATGYFAAIGVLCAKKYERPVYLGRNYCSNKCLKQYFFAGELCCDKERDVFSYTCGEPEYFRKLWEKNRIYSKDLITREGIRLLRPPGWTDSRMFYRNTDREAFYFIELSKGINAAVQSALEEADIVVIFLKQNFKEIRLFFQKFSSLIPKAIFIFTEYRRNTKCTPGYLRRIYGISSGRIGMIPVCPEHRQACEEGRIEEYICEHMGQEKKDVNFEFLKQLNNLAEKIVNLEEERRGRMTDEVQE